jgi:hypothetical protein
MTITISTAHNDARLAGSVSYLDTGSSHARIRLYSGTRPSAGGTATTLLCELTLPKPCGTVSAGVLTLGAPAADGQVLNTGIATWARIVNGNGDFAMDCDCSGPGGGGDIVLAQTQLYAGGYAHLVSAVLT